MNSDSDQERNIARVHESLIEIYTLMATLEAQIRSGRFPSQLEIRTAEFAMPKAFSPDMEEDLFLVDRC
jgi:hypothetical protein